MDALELLKKDHDRVSELFKEIEGENGSRKRDIFNEIRRELELHTHIEETIFYPAIVKPSETHDITLEAYEEHKVVKELLGELGDFTGPADEWSAKLKVLKENVEHHVGEEEGEMFSEARDVLSREQIERLGERMEQEKIARGGTPTKDAEAGKPGILAKIAGAIGLGPAANETKRGRGLAASGSAPGNLKAQRQREKP